MSSQELACDCKVSCTACTKFIQIWKHVSKPFKGRKIPGLIAGQVNFALGQVKIDVQWSCESEQNVSLINDNYQSRVIISKLETAVLVNF